MVIAECFVKRLWILIIRKVQGHRVEKRKTHADDKTNIPENIVDFFGLLAWAFLFFLLQEGEGRFVSFIMNVLNHLVDSKRINSIAHFFFGIIELTLFELGAVKLTIEVKGFQN